MIKLLRDSLLLIRDFINIRSYCV